MQLSFRHKEQLFHELAQLTRSATPIGKALEVMGRISRTRVGACARQLESAYLRVQSAAVAFQECGFPPRDVAVIEAGERSGRLEKVFPDLAIYYAQLAEAQQSVLAKSAYPVFLLHFGVLVLGVPAAIFHGGFSGYLTATLPVLLIFYVLAAILYFGSFFLFRLLATNATADRVFRAIPLLGGLFADWTAWNFSLIGSLYIRTGGGLLAGLETAAASSGSAVLTRNSLFALEGVRQGGDLAESFSRSREVPEKLLRAIEVGAHSGHLDDEFARSAEDYRQIVLRRLDVLAEWVPRLLYVAIVVLLGLMMGKMVMNIGQAYSGFGEIAP